MPFFLRTLCGILALAGPGFAARAQTPAERVLVVSPSVGEVIDGAEKAHFGLFLYYGADDFQEARFLQALAPDSAITLRTRLRNGRQVARPCTPAEFRAVGAAIARRLREVGPAPAPTLAPAASAPAAVPRPGRSAAVLPGQGPELVGRSYSVELRSGNAFIGVLQAASDQELEFATKDLGVVRIQRGNLKQLVLLTAGQAAKGYDDVGNGTRLFFAPTARNLRRGEGYLQNSEVFLLSANYGLTDNFSMGAIASFIPRAGSDNFFGLTPKVSFASSENVHLGGGALVLFVGGGAGGVAYGNVTYGSADHNFTAGLGYGFTGGGGFSSTPVLLLGGSTRVGRRISLLDETYILRARAGSGSATLVAGVAGVRVAGSRISGALGLAYFAFSYRNNGAYGSTNGNTVGDAFPYAELAVRFGKIK